ncbi:exopolysaccharide biosynthesis polyprenyl glycosylphosphotransferase [Alphaproteobacteria bacterium HT1-32]|nr:exopolysaccharide biosynthesis polyprenyl glycosylphosphotransferase [Alphaproteobacteria bacterium HT1-32]
MAAKPTSTPKSKTGVPDSQVKVDFRRKRIVRPVRAIPHRAPAELFQALVAIADGLAVALPTLLIFRGHASSALLLSCGAALLFIVIKTIGGGYAMVNRRASGDYLLRALQHDASRAIRDAITVLLAFSMFVLVQFTLFGSADFIRTLAAIGASLLLLPFSFLLRHWLSMRLRRAQFALRRSAIYGAGPDGVSLANRISNGELGESNAIIGVFDERDTRIALGGGVEAIAGDWNTLMEFASNGWVDTIFICMPSLTADRVQSLLARMKIVSVDVIRAPVADSDDPFTPLAERPLGGWNRIIKSVEDKLIGGIAIIALSPVMALIALAIKLESRGPVFYIQERVGFNNRPFTVYKYRSMYGDGDDARKFKQATRNDPRITRVGRILRRTSLDELPQLFNVMLGTMSLVGPRPHAPGTQTEGRYFHEVMDDYAHRHRVKPGITGWAQVNGFRGETDTRKKLEDRVRHDLYYIDNWSLALDIEVLFRTVLVVLTDKNAY